MPYIKPEDRELFEPFLNDLFGCFNEKDFTVGDLNYLMTRLAHNYTERHGLSYSTCNDVLGVFNAANQEYYRKVVQNYEEEKIRINGDVMPDYRGEEA